MSSSYLESVRKQFAYYKHLGDQTMAQLSEEELFQMPSPESNSVAVIVKHLWGNMLSRWTNFLTEDGEKTWRQRDEEFENDLKDKAEVLEKWETGWTCLFGAIDPLKNDDLERIIYIRNQGHTVTEAINRQMMHYAYHVGQLVVLGKMMKGAAWKSLSIAKGASKSYNEEKFAQTKGKEHFTDEWMNKS